MFRTALVSAISALMIMGAGYGQDVKFKADISGIVVASTKSPDFEVGSGVVKKKETRRDWIEIDVGFMVDSTDRDDFVGTVKVNFYVLPSGAQKQHKKLYKATINHVDVLKGEELHSSVYISPNSIARLYGKGKAANPRDLMVAVEIHIGGKLVGGDVTDGKSSRWWQKKDVPTDESLLRPKAKTPFAYLWYDRFAETRD